MLASQGWKRYVEFLEFVLDASCSRTCFISRDLRFMVDYIALPGENVTVGALANAFANKHSHQLSLVFVIFTFPTNFSLD